MKRTIFCILISIISLSLMSSCCTPDRRQLEEGNRLMEQEGEFGPD